MFLFRRQKNLKKIAINTNEYYFNKSVRKVTRVVEKGIIRRVREGKVSGVIVPVIGDYDKVNVSDVNEAVLKSIMCKFYDQLSIELDCNRFIWKLL